MMFLEVKTQIARYVYSQKLFTEVNFISMS